MNFSEIFNPEEIKSHLSYIDSVTPQQVENSLSKNSFSFTDFLHFISPPAESYLENMAQIAHKITLQKFGKVVQMYIPLYLSNECNNICAYCGFRHDIKMNRYTLPEEEVLKEAHKIKEMGFNHILLVSGTAPKQVNMEYLKSIISKLKKDFPSITLEIYTLSQKQYEILYKAGAEGVTVYQETYNPEIYPSVHLSGSKKDFKWRLDTPDRIGKANLRKINLGSLLGLGDWRYEAIALAQHSQYLLKQYWQAALSLSFPRITDHPQNFNFTPVSDKHLVQMLLAFRLFIPDMNLVLSTREKAKFRMHLIQLGATQISAGSKTTPGGYYTSHSNKEEQFAIEDTRPPDVVAKEIQSMGYEPVWKDWESVL